MKMLAKGLYLVKTQAGFNKAIKQWVSDDDYVSRSSHFDYPKQYPSIVKFYSYYQGYHGYNCTCTPINEYKEYLTKLLKEIDNA